MGNTKRTGGKEVRFNLDKIQEELVSQLQTPTVFTIPLFGGIPVSDSVVVTWVLMAALVVTCALMTRRLKLRPGRGQILLEMFVGLINGFCKESIGEHWRSFAPYLGTVALYLAVANLCGMVGLTPPTKDVNVTAGLAIMSVFLIYGAQFRFRGLRGGLKKFAEPMPLLIPINLMEIAIRPLSLCMRLFGNVLGSFVVMELIKVLVPAVIPIPFSLYFDVFDGIIQTIVFVFLTTLFVGEAVEE